ncbi:Flp pilus assembly protein CpaB [Tepidibacillus fermentans]|uniref:Pilus assembly protein CpaB n=1 Tax=Tepidibacillus fermentans TaxID=1281767 RepID=A0A4R3KJ91_9BACI|nr:Flp pilus assembly protein CpaB [Tepidibacillus fermentans]TCS83335.1 pilus assembly protein CpaB [Tepidibacillus fermentans]
MKVTNRHLFLLALFLGLTTTFFIYFYLSKVETVNQSLEPTKKVVVAKVTIQPKTKITKEMVEMKGLKVSALSESTYTDIKDILGKTVKETIYSGEPIVNQRLADQEYQKTHLAYSVPKGYRAITLQYSSVMGVGGFIESGDYVDVIGTFDQKIMQGASPEKDVSKIILQNVLVLAVGNQTDEKQGGEKEKKQIETVTLAVKPHDAERLTFTEERGSIRLILRPINEQDQPQTGGITNQNLFTP